MSLTAEQDAALREDEPTEDTTEAPASGEQPTTETQAPASGEQPAEGAEKDEAEGESKDGEKKPDEPTPEAKRDAWKQVETAKREQVKVARARQELQTRIQRVEAYEAELEQRHQSRTADLDAREARIRPLEEALEKRDLDALIALGFDYEDATRRHLENQTPQGIAKRALEENQRLRKELEEDRKKKDEAQRQAAQVAETRQVAMDLCQIVDTDPSIAAELYAWPPERIANEGLHVRAALFRAKRGQMPTFGEVIDELERRAKREAATANERQNARQQKSRANPSDAGSAGKVETRDASGSPGTPALTGDTANQRLSPPREKTEEEIDEECKAMLRGLKR